MKVTYAASFTKLPLGTSLPSTAAVSVPFPSTSSVIFQSPSWEEGEFITATNVLSPFIAKVISLGLLASGACSTPSNFQCFKLYPSVGASVARNLEPVGIFVKSVIVL